MNENQPKSVSEMVRTTSANTAEFMDKIADHIDKLEAALIEANAIIEELRRAKE